MPKQPNILLLFSDEHSFRFMGHRSADAGGEPIETPNFDRLAAQATVFTDAYCQMPLCTPSRISMLTGREVRRCCAWDNGSVLRPELPTLPGTLRDAGYTTCLVGKMHLGGTQQFVGFEHRPYGDLTGKCGHQSEPIPEAARDMRGRTNAAVGVTQIPESLIQDEVVCHESLGFLREQTHANPEKPWFLCAGFSRPHFPLTAPRRHLERFWPDNVTPPKVPASGDAYDHPMSVGMRNGFRADDISHDEMMYARACYFACVSYLDEIIGDFLLRLGNAGLLDNTIVVYTTDHGEMAGEHGVWWKNGWYEACTRVPLIVSTPAHRSGALPASTCPTPVALVDLFPTFASLAGIDPPAGLDGVDLSQVITAGQAAPDRPIFCDALSPRWGEGTEFRSVRQGRYKYVRFRNAPPLAFDLDADPGEQRNLLESGKPVPKAMEQLAAFANASIDFDEAERERTVRDGGLHEQYAHGIGASTGNLYVMPNGSVINAEDTLYSPTVIAPSLAEMMGSDWKQQNGSQPGRECVDECD
jgi:choline-sulfatase